MKQLEVTVGIGGAAGDGSGATGDNLAKVCSRLGLHVFAYNSYQSLVRGGHVWLRLRIAAQKVMTDRYPALGVGREFTGKQRMVASGNEMFGLGALAAGCKLYAAYPMAPSTAVLHWLARHAASHDIVVKQCEDEIAVLNLAIGAAHVGVRAMCATSGGGFSLMTEAVGLAGMTETPVWGIDVQCGGPSTGLPTKTEQSDLNQLFGASQGDYPRAILAPTDVV